MFQRRIKWAIVLTLLLCLAGIAIDENVGPDNPTWNRIVSVMNVPGGMVLKLVGPGHGILQLVLPFVASLVFYVAVFWLLLAAIERLRIRRPAGQ
jgi:hypothetical protein